VGWGWGEIDASCSLELLESVEYLFEARPDVGVLRPAIGSQASPVVRRITGEVCVCVHGCGRAQAWRQRHRPHTAGSNTAHMRGGVRTWSETLGADLEDHLEVGDALVRCHARHALPQNDAEGILRVCERERDHRRCQVTQRHENGRRHRRVRKRRQARTTSHFSVYFSPLSTSGAVWKEVWRHSERAQTERSKGVAGGFGSRKEGKERTHDGVPQEVMVSIAVSMRESPKSLTLHRQCSPTNKLCCNPHPNNH
jgi:hypothetical protein